MFLWWIVADSCILCRVPVKIYRSSYVDYFMVITSDDSYYEAMKATYVAMLRPALLHTLCGLHNFIYYLPTACYIKYKCCVLLPLFDAYDRKLPRGGKIANKRVIGSG